MRITSGWPQMQLFSAKLAARYGLKQAIVHQELIQAEGRRCAPDPENGVVEEEGELWYRYAPEELINMFPYMSANEIQVVIQDIERLGWIEVRRGKTTDYLWINIP